MSFSLPLLGVVRIVSIHVLLERTRTMQDQQALLEDHP